MAQISTALGISLSYPHLLWFKATFECVVPRGIFIFIALGIYIEANKNKFFTSITFFLTIFTLKYFRANFIGAEPGPKTLEMALNSKDSRIIDAVKRAGRY